MSYRLKVDLFTTIIALLMLADSLFVLLNIVKVESILKSVFPKFDVKKLAIIEGIVGLIILIIKISTKTIS